MPSGSFGLNDVLMIRAESTVNAAVSSFVQNTTVVASLGFELKSDNSGVLGPERRVTYTHLLFNTGTAADTYTLNYVASAGWSVNGPSSVSLAGGDSQEITVELQAPVDPTGGADVTVVTATSQLDNALQASVTDSTFRAVWSVWLPFIEQSDLPTE